MYIYIYNVRLNVVKCQQDMVVIVIRYVIVAINVNFIIILTSFSLCVNK